MRRLLVLGAVLLCACPSPGPLDGGAGGGSGDAGLVPCPDRPGEPPRPPSGQLPCELIPPGFAP
ncbi:MAG: hypothetical protein IPJ65_35950 [Archangiaceae bacterium]|nr:hypothetical protein [Archangiaceae bacterium]